MGLSFEFQEQLRAIEESIKPVDLTSEISQYQDEVREGYVPEKKATPETDAAAFDIPHHGADGTGSRVAVVHYQAACKLEREREEDREYAERCKQGCIKLSYAIDRIDYACGEPNEMEVSDYAMHQNEERVIQRVKEKLEALRLLDWTPVTKRLPTIKDANEFEDVEWSDGKDIWQKSFYLPNSNQHKATHWRSITLP